MKKTNLGINRNIITVKADTSLHEAIRILAGNSTTSLPVVTNDMRLIGILSEKDLMKLLYNPNLNYKTVADLMTRDIICFDVNTDLVEICKCLIEKDFRRVPIVSNGKFVGVISRKDIIKSLLL
ncbi:MAG: CBS domain-containing protein [bacterium]